MSQRAGDGFLGRRQAMPRENARDRGRRLVAEGRLVIRRVNEEEILAVCRGDSGEVHELGYYPNGGWWCDCVARTRCAHLVALMLVVVTP
jgi:uncharacterized Zn finger protein